MLALAGAVAIAANDLSARREAFETDARIIHRLFSQRVVQHDAILDTLAILQPGGASEATPEERLPAIYPQLLRVLRRAAAGWSGADAGALQGGEKVSRAAGRAALAGVDFAGGRYTVVRAADPASFALIVDLAALAPTAEWPLAADAPARVRLEFDGQRRVLHAGAPERSSGWRFDFRKHLAADSQPFDVVAELDVGWAELPWLSMLAWVAALAAAIGLAQMLLDQREARRRAQELLRLGQVGRLNALGELAAGMAHEVNQPLTAVLANANAAERLLDDDPPDVPAARDAIGQAARQAQRAGEVVGRLRRAVERPELGERLQPVRLDEVVRPVLDLLRPDCRRLGVAPALAPPQTGRWCWPSRWRWSRSSTTCSRTRCRRWKRSRRLERRLELSTAIDGDRGVLTVADSGPGIPVEALPRVFEPFFTTRPGGLGLGLSLCETLAASMQGTLACTNAEPRGAVFRLALPLAPSTRR